MDIGGRLLVNRGLVGVRGMIIIVVVPEEGGSLDPKAMPTGMTR